MLERDSLEGISPQTMTNKRRFSEEQIKSLETMFDAENKLEPRKKMQLARELGLQPRQIAIWYQNRRARYKSKQLEREYSALKSNYDALASNFESLKKEKQALLNQLQKLGDQIDKPHGSESREENGNAKSEYKEKAEGSDLKGMVYSDGEDSKNIGYCKETEFLRMVELINGSLSIPEKISTLDSSCYPDQSSSSLQWWELWP